MGEGQEPTSQDYPIVVVAASQDRNHSYEFYIQHKGGQIDGQEVFEIREPVGGSKGTIFPIVTRYGGEVVSYGVDRADADNAAKKLILETAETFARNKNMTLVDRLTYRAPSDKPLNKVTADHEIDC